MKGIAKLGEFGERRDEQQREQVGEKKNDDGESQVKNGSEKEDIYSRISKGKGSRRREGR